ncbi:2-octaprenyl-6-methoxyphenol hydroxylase [Cognatiyoonia sediminum]|uniref:2-octaprenyl-6-methoxyphenol hydroxylase n=1 Tax=Cognatiyoonia sediminum TaxID=1508389 RepID=A0A1M5RIH9_9RHOB|nr:UbiH/UbiF/VisC/COQ6 family ubiquinone biosynthesis hydroxylase [Cognatiyoonia sediminum]SHH25623.1 2-octaprenyl-6-methoxyphenol hydroxylase [Cognatiyoonia sediminum]
MDTHSDILIVGGGLNGPALALALGNAGFSVRIVDSLPKDVREDAEFDGRAYALALGSQRLLSGIGVWPTVEPNAQPMLEIKVTDGRAGEGPSPWMMHFDHAEIDEGPMGYLVEDRHLRRAFLSAMEDHPKLEHIAPATVVDQTAEAGRISIALADGSTLSASVLIGSDGRSSGTAQRAGIKRTAWDYGQTALVCAAEHAKPHGGIAHQFFMPGGPLAILPLTGNRSAIVWSEDRAKAHHVAAFDDDGFLDALRPAFGDFLGEITLCGERFTYPLGLSIATSLVADRVALIGDAAHGIHPIAGQGLNAGLRDVAALVDVLIDARKRGEDFGGAQALARYQSWRQFDTTKLAMATDGFNRLFSNDNPLLRAARDIGMGVINASPALRRAFIREAAGLNGDLPSLMAR